MATLENIDCAQTLLGSPAILWPLISHQENWALWFAQTSSDLVVGKPFDLTITYFPTEETNIWQAEIRHIKEQVALEFTLNQPDLALQTSVKFFIRQNNDTIFLTVQQSGFQYEGFLHALKIRKERKRLLKFWQKALLKLQYQVERRLGN
ncbi:hypothetical protein [Entomospira culicis]|uniref:Uncharacterized protein n=1 Tax=Entomospira culicis TaxID=2719989 RepID=A0A968GFN7_9SPIO|nr:hypothetical protein [Entomospira culicis]NIZ19364.1 hypothetical protein [Entomospira culicis]NIZ69731.1 hypothetical protein [Entomospira culicis]WDI36842.1 hypothetical protein PVA46_05820 [Entomospira culicis]WDI38471.1 hypothetical protein PVA47_05830 [Entomospira culicis]